MIRLLLTDGHDDTMLVEFASADDAGHVGMAAVFSDGGVSAWLVPEVAVDGDTHKDRLLDLLREGSNIDGVRSALDAGTGE